MLLTLALVVFCSAIIVFFAEEFGGVAKKIFAIPGVKLILPLLIASSIVALYEDWIVWILLINKYAFHSAMSSIASLFPFEQFAAETVQILFLLILTLVPPFIFITLRKRKTILPFPYTWLICLLLWLFFSILFTVK
ncbi:hypothetical protein Lqui_1502 [Legionella quinlivanii]|uniref:Uncharacterized protein n=1 Tax=Legionella quinlivanii TaxID=45073 RepID=A0A0W0XZG5_9GAMM|nr:hypothetical protein [Legionella quinlivanii]KTD50177.1 hypothetical protein Lqui_1502 [Legionella quinlivanii]MCW8450078.1 hypothetical protein [Legionella quinlivanii]SEF48597.1 hypothetical protein SAMN02746093_00335 [Legionella quinlivanii DSM 21216]STY11775.1 Uncharacterised protein [Legionella quinlivanii]